MPHRRSSLTAALLPIALAAAAGIGACGGTTAKSTRTVARTPPHRAGGAPVSDLRLRASASGQLPAPVRNPATTALGGRAILMGGLDQAIASTANVVIAEPRGSRLLTPLPFPVHDAAAASLGGRAYLLGGGEPSHDEIIAVGATGRPTVAGRLPAPASDVAAASIGHDVYVVGGYTGTAPLNTIVAWSGSGVAKVVATLPHAIRYAAVAAAGGRLIIAGGTVGDTASAAIYSFDPATRRVAQLGLLPRPITHAGAAELGGRVYIVGGRGSTQGTQTAEVLALNPATGHVTPAGRLPVAESDVGTATVPSGIIVAGGRELSGAVSDRLYLLSPLATAR
ncbi:MAG TPA: hypothetical protein VG371_06630 [Solirubrobacteraceae bacterium]|nr:hypothetical protein [Solirubrobacteraceae bacterium]